MKKLLLFLLALAAMAALILPALAEASVPPESAAPDYSLFEGKSWDEIIDEFFEERSIKGPRVSLGYYNTVTGEEHYYNGDELRTGASIYKLPLMMYFAEKLYLGEIDRETEIGPYKYDDLMFHAIRYSSNPAGEAMQKYFDTYKDYKTAIGKFLDIDGLPEDSLYFTTNRFSARMMVSCLKFLCAEPDRYPDLMDSLLTTERGNYLGFSEERYDIAHKLGYLQTDEHTYLNDCAVVFTEQPIILVMLTDNIYGGVGSMGAWCTLMCDYTDYMQTVTPPAAPESTPEPTVEPTAAPEPTEAPEHVERSEEPGLAARRAVLVFFCATAAVLFAAMLIMKIKAGGRAVRGAAHSDTGYTAAECPGVRAALPLGLASLSVALLTILVCVYAGGATPRILSDAGDPAASASAVLDALCARSADLSDYFVSGVSPELDRTPESATAARAYDALLDSWAYTLGHVEQEGISARVAVTLKRLDLAAVAADLNAAVTEELSRMVAAARLESDIYDDDGQYHQEFVSRALSGAVAGMTESGEYLDSADFTLTMVYERGRWLALWDRDFASALSGGALDSAAILADGVEMYVTNASSAGLEGIVKIEKIYTLPEDTVVAPEPDQTLFGTASTPEEIAVLLDSASSLLKGQETTLAPETPLFGAGGVSYYLDETIFAACWKELINGCVYTFSEVKVAHPSQFRRMIGGDEFGSELLYHPSDLAAGCNAVAALSGDYYLFRNMGIVVHKGQLYRTRGDYIDSCMIDGNGDLHFVYARDIATEQEALDYIAANDIRFSLVFGPVLVDNGELVHKAAYPLGEVKDQYSRCGFGQLGELHYLLATANNEAGYGNVPVIDDFAAVFKNHGCVMAYTLDGGQTGTMVMNDKVMNSVTFGYQRNISDIIFFATALPEQGRAGNE